MLGYILQRRILCSLFQSSFVFILIVALSLSADDLVSKDDPMLTEAALTGGGGGNPGLTASSSQESLLIGEDSSSSYDFETLERVRGFFMFLTLARFFFIEWTKYK